MNVKELMQILDNNRRKKATRFMNMITNGQELGVSQVSESVNRYAMTQAKKAHPWIAQMVKYNNTKYKSLVQAVE